MLNSNSNISSLIRKKYQSHLSIKTTTQNHTYSINKDYINLRVTTLEQAATENNNDIETTVDISSIFDDGADSLKRVVIYGRPGVGKSTLCQHLAYEWQEGKLWNDKFDALIRLSLKDIAGSLLQESTALRNLALCVKEHYVDDEELSIENLHKYLKDNKNRILIVLDGYDEISQIIEGNVELQKLLQLVFNDYHVIITSRPIPIRISYDNHSAGLVVFDKELQNMGLTAENIKSFVRIYCKEKPEELIKDIESRKDLRDIAYIPLNLGLICSAWDGGVIDQGSITITKLYDHMTEELLDISNEKSAIEPEAREALRVLLGRIGLELMKSGLGSIRLSEIRKLTNSIETETGLTGLLNLVLNLGIIKAENKDLKDDNNKANFIHHTYGEYFAAVGITKGFESYIGDDEYKQAIAMLRERKYTPYYEVMWISVVGQLYASCNEKGDYLPLYQFWDAFENEPRELVGLMHDRLLLKLVGELEGSKSEVVRELRNKLISRTKVISELIKIIENKDIEPALRLRAIDALVELEVKDEEIVAALVKLMKEDEIEGIRLYAAEGLLRLGQNSKEALDVLIKAPEYLKEYKQAALARVYKVEGSDSGIRSEIEKLIGNNDNQLDKIDFIRLALTKPGLWQVFSSNIGTDRRDNDTRDYQMRDDFYSFLAGVLIRHAVRFLLPGVIAVGTNISKRIFYHLINSSYLDLDKLLPANNNVKLQAICDKASNNRTTVTAWSKEGRLTIDLAIRLYSFSSQVVWLEPMKEITFIYKDASILLTINNKLIRDKTQALTKNWNQTKAVLDAMKEAYTKAKLPAELMDHYLHNTNLDVSSDKEKLDISRRIRSNRPMELTPLHKVAEKGDIAEVKKLVEAKEIDINDFNNHNWETPLIVAIKNKKWDVVEYLLEAGADVNIGGALDLAQSINAFEKVDRMVIKGLLNKSSLKQILFFAIDDYKLQTASAARQEVLNRFALSVSGIGREWMEDIGLMTDIYHLFLGNISRLSREGTDFGIVEGALTTIILRMRLHIYLELYIKIGSLAIHDLPKIKGVSMTQAETLDKLFTEIKTTRQTLASTQYQVCDELFQLYLESLYKHLGALQRGEEVVFSTIVSYSKDLGHCIYVALHKFCENKVLIRIDNRCLISDFDNMKHGVLPYKNGNKIKSYCMGIIDLKQNKDVLFQYIISLFRFGDASSKLPHIYGKYLPKEITLLYHQLPTNIQNYIEMWPYHRIQSISTNNCTLSSYNLGISVRHGMEFFEWLIGKEQQLAPPLSSVNSDKIIIYNQENMDKYMKCGGVKIKYPEMNHTHSELMRKFQQALNIPYSQVFTGIAVEQSVVGLAGITTNQMGASFRQYDTANTVFHLNFQNLDEHQVFIEFYNRNFSGLIVDSQFREEKGKISVIMNTRKLFEEVIPVLGKIYNNNRKENNHDKFI